MSDEPTTPDRHRVYRNVCDLLDVAEDRIGRYELIRELGAGGSAVVWEAYDPDLDRRVAIKRLRDAGPEERERLRREALAASRLGHPNVVTIHEVGPDHIVMELVEGRTLAELWPTLTVEQRLDQLMTVTAAVAEAHARGIVHRDIKPGNVLATAAGRVVLTDFGLARVADGEDLTRTGAVMGTPHYMAPEQVRGNAVAANVDVWALGVMLYEALTGKRPFDGESTFAIYEAIVRGRAPTLPGPLGQVVARALAKDPGARPADAGALLALLRQARRGKAPGGRVPRLMIIAGGVALLAVGIARLARLGQGDEDALNRALRQNPNDVSALLARGRVHLARSDESRFQGRNPLAEYAAAEADFARAVRLAPESRDARYWLGHTRAQRAAYHVTWEISPGDDCARAEADLAAALPDQRARVWRGNLRLVCGIWRRHQQDQVGARERFLAAEADLTPASSSDALMRRGRVRALLGRYDEAERDFEASIAANDRDPFAWTWRAVARREAGEPLAAERHLLRAVQVAPKHAQAWQELGDLRFAMGRFREAAEAWKAAVAHNPALSSKLQAKIDEAQAK